MWRSAPAGGDVGGGLQLDPVALVVIDGEREQPIAGLAGEAAATIESRPPESRTTARRSAVMAADIMREGPKKNGPPLFRRTAQFRPSGLLGEESVPTLARDSL